MVLIQTVVNQKTMTLKYYMFVFILYLFMLFHLISALNPLKCSAVR